MNVCSLSCSASPGTDSKGLFSSYGIHTRVTAPERGKSNCAFNTHNQHVWMDVNPPSTYSECSSATLFYQCLGRNNRRPPTRTLSSARTP
ncbi:hypothetical protein AVEN_222242-1 [Araneus ventricosus]|uniref:Uncharacterized protein n=1 Tax=Araneus ventricosus TaxID=182803 RepID=A0A4Y2JWE4_ARAVE|nr:hypothetical protein AVEN_222242-1 [Araneus ventricosus]